MSTEALSCLHAPAGVRSAMPSPRPGRVAGDENPAAAARLLVCAPHHFAVDYVINPWMAGQVGQADPRRAQAQWQALWGEFSSRADLIRVDPVPGLPDMVFTANAGFVWGDHFWVSRFRCPERQPESAPFAAWAREQSFRVVQAPMVFEGAGDALIDRYRRCIWVGYGPRSDADASAWLAAQTGADCRALRLVDARFYHLDTCLCPLPDGGVLMYPGAFDARSRASLKAAVAPVDRIIVDERDAAAFACNAVVLPDPGGHHTLVMPRVSEGLVARLHARGLRVVQLNLGEFLRAGGAARCLTLRLDEPEFGSRWPALHRPGPARALMT